VDVGLIVFVVSLLVFWILVYLLLRGKSERVEVGPGYLLVRAGIRLDPMGPGFQSRLWRFFGYISLVLLVISAIVFYYYTGKLFILRYIKPPICRTGVAGFVPFIPGVTMSWTATIYIGIALGIAALFHELSHAIVARSVGVKVKDAGLAFFLFIPAAFVEPDDEELEKAPVKKKALIYSAGVGANVILGLLFLGLTLTIISGVAIVGVTPGSPADKSGLKPGMIILSVNGTEIKSTGDLEKVLQQLGATDPNKNVTLLFKVKYKGDIKNIIVERPANKTAGPCSRAKIGIYINTVYKPIQELGILSFLLFIINISLAVVNAAPLIIPLPGGSILSDGAYVLRDSLKEFMGEKPATLATFAIGVGTLLLILSLLSFQKIM